MAQSDPLAIVIDEFAYIGSEGCFAFGDPVFFMKHRNAAGHARTHGIDSDANAGAGATSNASDTDADGGQEDSAALVTELVTIISHSHSQSQQDDALVAVHSRQLPLPGGVYRSSLITAPQLEKLQANDAWFSQALPPPIQQTDVTETNMSAEADLWPPSPSAISAAQPKSMQPPDAFALHSSAPRTHESVVMRTTKTKTNTTPRFPETSAVNVGAVPKEKETRLRSLGKWTKDDLEKWCGLYWDS